MKTAVVPVEYETPHAGLKFLEYFADHSVFHPGWDLNKGIGNQDEGNPIVAPFDGEVEYIGPIGKANGGFGNFIVLKHAHLGVWTQILHMKSIAPLKVGEKFNAGHPIGQVGKTGTSSAHCHLETFNEKCREIKRTHALPYQFYPSHKSKAWVSEHYIDGLALVESLNAKHETALEWCIRHLPESEWTGVSENEAERYRALATRVMSWLK